LVWALILELSLSRDLMVLMLLSYALHVGDSELKLVIKLIKRPAPQKYFSRRLTALQKAFISSSLFKVRMNYWPEWHLKSLGRIYWIKLGFSTVLTLLLNGLRKSNFNRARFWKFLVKVWAKKDMSRIATLHDLFTVHMTAKICLITPRRWRHWVSRWETGTCKPRPCCPRTSSFPASPQAAASIMEAESYGSSNKYIWTQSYFQYFQRKFDICKRCKRLKNCHKTFWAHLISLIFSVAQSMLKLTFIELGPVM